MGKSKLGMGEIVIFFNTVLDLYQELEVWEKKYIIIKHKIISFYLKKLLNNKTNK
jgi:hypothetical protein